ncbi:hypothetical protein HU200_032419 [Digitaria exilis]|uniref:DUF1618 domain-containing protein n=1 Tax=Digitaria exilis TaxID=1010633 RepID=A0A835BKY5_9POAL|nr:hypothetical protein HU200_032419 [Digitaria exilis]
MGCVAGDITFVTLAGFHERRDPRDMVLETWTLSRDLNEWVQQGKRLAVADLWASESFRERGLPQLTPAFPVLSVDDADVVYVVMNDVENEKRLNDYGEVRPGKMVHKAHYMLCLNTVQNRVVSFTHVVPDNFRPHFRDVLATEFSAYL